MSLAAMLHLMIPRYTRTWDVKVVFPDGTVCPGDEYQWEPVIFAHSEQAALILTYFLGLSPFVLLVANGRDGDWASEVLGRMGVITVRGSSGANGSRALLRWIRLLRASSVPSSISTDGPLGPLGRVGPGVVVCGARAQRPVIPVGAAAWPALRLRGTWAQMLLPAPFARVRIALGQPVHLAEKLTRRQTEVWRVAIQTEIARQRRRAARSLGGHGGLRSRFAAAARAVPGERP